LIEGVRGVLRAKREGEVAVDVNGVVLRIAVSSRTSEGLPEPGSRVDLLTRLVVREDALDLYGFASEPEREAFSVIAETKGMGPKLAMRVLSGVSVRDFQLAVLQGDTARLSTIRGIGKGRAEQLVFALRKKVAGLAAEGEERAKGVPVEDAVKTLVALGYPEPEAARAVGDAVRASGAASSVQDIVVAALRRLSG
jgi:Holliday junction DNA helicase RuvA